MGTILFNSTCQQYVLDLICVDYHNNKKSTKKSTFGKMASRSGSQKVSHFFNEPTGPYCEAHKPHQNKHAV
jgi:hypothetical protein